MSDDEISEQEKIKSNYCYNCDGYFEFEERKWDLKGYAHCPECGELLEFRDPHSTYEEIYSGDW